VIRSVSLGDRWDGEAKISKNTVIVTKRGPGVGVDSKGRPTVTITAVRP
jgi:predicted RNA-binding protein with TRAM domain